MFYRSCLLLPVFVFTSYLTNLAQSPPINFHHLTVKQGLNDGVINGICEDRYGSTWFASLGALNRFNSSTVKKFTHVHGDSNSLPNDVPYALAAARDDRLWVGYIDGLVEFNAVSGACKRIKALQNRNIFALLVTDDNRLYVGSSKGPACYNPVSGKLEDLVPASDTASVTILKKRFYDLYRHANKIYMGAVNGVIEYDPVLRRARFIDLPMAAGAINRMVIDDQGSYWISNISKHRLLRISKDRKKVEVLDTLLASKNDNRLTSALDMRSGNNRVWIITGQKGLLEYNILSGKALFHEHKSQYPSGISDNSLRTMHQGKDGSIWVTSNSGVDYFHPDKSLFSIIFPFDDEKESKYSRAVIEDHLGNFWFTTVNGISEHNPRTNTYRAWQNEPGNQEVIWYNSVRGIAEDDDGNIWVATGGGVNKWNRQTGIMAFLSMKDSIPQGFYFSANKLADGTIWFGTRDNDGFYFYSPRDKKIHSIASHPGLKNLRGRGGRYVMQDSKNRLWFGFNGSGVAMYDPATKAIRRWMDGSAQGDNIAGNLIVDIKEDKKGVIWISAFGGISGIDLEHNRYYRFTDRNGLKSSIAGPIAIDGHNRLWIGTAAGLALLDSSRKNFTYFGEESGLPVMEFPEHPGYTLANGDILLPSVKGYVRFNPLLYKEPKSRINFFISSINVFDKEYPLWHDSIASVKLGANDNFFSIGLVALNYENPSRTWFAYQLEGFDKTWQYTQDPKAVYTNVPGGKYVFRYKATQNVNDWDVPEKTLPIHVATVFYKAWWFFALLAALTAGILYYVYRNRLSNQARFHRLQSKAQLLEKEKTLVMYESLKQQLNPHFLFNSLTSLSGLIETDQKMAGNFLAQMSKIYRYILKNRESEVVSLQEEIKFAQLYINLQKTRFRNGLQVAIHTNPEQEQYKIAPVTIQNLVENAIKHNIIDQDTPLMIEIYTEQDYLAVKNNLQKKNVVESSNSQGLVYLQSLYKYLSEKPILISADDGYFIIKVPLIQP